MGKEVISDFLVRLGFDGKAVTKGVAEAERALARLKKAKIASIKQPKDVELNQAVKATKQRIQAEQLVQRIKEKQRAKESVARRKDMAHVKRLLRAKAALRRTNALHFAGMLPEGEMGAFRDKISKATSVEQIKNIRAEIGRSVKNHKEVTRQMSRQFTLANAMKFSFSGIISSLKNLARSWVSVFAIIGGAVAGLRITQQFQALDASMLAVSDSSESAAKNVKFLTDLSTELPINLMKAGDEFRSLLSSGRDLVGEQGVKDIFKSFVEYGTALQADPERMSRAMVAVGQIFNKQVLMAEEVKNQLGENLAGALPLLAKSLDMSMPELFKAMENGELMAKDVMPKFAEELSRAARNNDALTKSLKTSRSAWTMLVSKFQLLFKGFGSDRLDKGVASFTQALSKLLDVIKPVAQTIFWIIGLVADLLGIIGKGLLTAFDPWLNMLKALEPSLNFVGKALNAVDGATMEWLGHLAKFAVFLHPLSAAAAIIGGIAEEIMNIFTGHAQGLLAGQGETIAERLSNGFINKWMQQLSVWWDATALPWFKEKADQLAKVFRDALQNILPPWMMKGLDLAVDAGEAILPQVDKAGWFLRENLLAGARAVDNSVAKLFGQGTQAAPQSREDMVQRAINNARSTSNTPTQVIVNVDGEEKINKIVEERTSVDYLVGL